MVSFKIYFSVAHDPTQLNRQGPTGERNIVRHIFANDEQKRVASLYRSTHKAAHLPQVIVTQLVPLKGFYAAEEYHQHHRP